MNSFVFEDALKLVLALITGGFIGMEREYRSKAAGFRTMILIAIGSTLFTMISVRIGAPASMDRVAANIITGIGFLGAGVVFKDSTSVTGLTTAASIWATASLGMAIGIGEYQLAFFGLLLVITVLALFEKVQIWIEHFNQKHTYKIIFNKSADAIEEIERKMNAIALNYVVRKELKNENENIYFFEVSGTRENIKRLNSFLMNNPSVKSFEC